MATRLFLSVSTVRVRVRVHCPCPAFPYTPAKHIKPVKALLAYTRALPDTRTVDVDADRGHGQKQACSHKYHDDLGRVL